MEHDHAAVTPGLHIVADDRVPGLAEALRGVEGVAEVRLLPGRDIGPADVAAADVLVTRTRTRCDERLLRGSRVRLVCTATIGTDHIDLGWCAAHGVAVASAPGCNAPAVNQYVWQAVADAGLDAPVMGVVGVGNVGGLVAAEARRRGLPMVLNDPPRAKAGAAGFEGLEAVAGRAQVVTLHTPLTAAGPHPTRHLISDPFFRLWQARVPGPRLLINAARGGVVDEAALLHAMDADPALMCVIDCWEGEPDVNRELLQRALRATPHIAGYSVQGKRRATGRVADVIRAFAAGRPVPEAPEPERITPTAFDLDALSRAFKAAPADMERLRDTTPLRSE